jgi:hydroxyversicolorone monooxygenase
LTIVDTAKWPEEYGKDQWGDESVAIIGSGASSIQTLPSMQPFVKHIDVYIRTGIWFVPILDNYGAGEVYTEEQRDKFRTDPKALLKHAKSLEDGMNSMWSMFFKDSEIQSGAQEMFKERMSSFIKDERLIKGYTPKFPIGCRRITPGKYHYSFYCKISKRPLEN